MVEGEGMEVVRRGTSKGHTCRTYVLEPGDALTFPGGVPHGPERLMKLPIRFLSVILDGDEDG